MKPMGPQGTPYHMNPDVPHIKNPKPAANDLLRELLTAPGGLDKMKGWLSVHAGLGVRTPARPGRRARFAGAPLQGGAVRGPIY